MTIYFSALPLCSRGRILKLIHRDGRRAHSLRCLAIGILGAWATACSHTRLLSPAAQALRCLQPAARSPAASTPRYTWGTNGQANGDAWIARYDENATQPSWRTTIAGAGQDSISSMATLNEKEIAVVGTTTSPSLPGIESRNRDRRTGFVLRLSVTSGEVLSGSFAGGTGGSELHGVAATRDGRILVAGVGTTAEAYGTPAIPRVRQVEIEGGNPATAQPLFLSVYTSDLRREIGRIDLGRSSVRRPRVWLDCQGVPVVGTVALTNGECAGPWPDLVYQQGEFTEDYDLDFDWNQTAILGSPPGGWGFHALRWKSYHVGPTFTLTWPPLNSTPAVPRSSIPSCTDAQALNTLETTVTVFSSDPSGWWLCGQHTDMANLSLVAAYMFSKWTTPVYTHVQRWNNLSGPWVKVPDSVAVERVVFHPVCPTNAYAYTGQKIEDLCDLTVDDVANVGCQASDLFGGVIGSGFFLRFERFEGTRWYNGGQVWYQRPVTYPASTGPWWYNKWYEAGDYVFDPPDNSEHEQAIVQEAARQMSGSIVRPQRVMIRTIEGGRVTSKKTVEALIPASE